MQPEQPNTPSTDVQPSDAAVAEPSSEPRSEGSSPSWWQKLFNRREETSTSEQDSTEANSASKPLSLTTEELERRIQAETDRREAKRATDAKRQARKELRDKDPWAYAQQDREEEQQQDQTAGVQQFFANVGTAHDRVSIDPLMEALPKAEVERIMKLESAGVGLDGRKLVVKEGLKALEKHWKAEGAREAEARLRRNSAFRKQILAETRGSTVEPDLLPGSESAGDHSVSALLRNYYHVS